MIIETSANKFYRVTETGNPDLAHVWYGVPVKKVAGVWISNATSKTELVRKAATRIVKEA